MQRNVLFLALVFFAGSSFAQSDAKWLAVGRLHHPYSSSGAEYEGYSPDGWSWPGIRPAVAWNHSKGLWISARNWTSPTSTVFPVRNSHVGPRVNGSSEVFPIKHELVARFQPTTVTVEGQPGGGLLTRPDFIDAALPADQMIETVVNTSVGVTVTRRAMQWSSPFHDSYHLVEYVFQNTGNVDADAQVELPSQSLSQVYFVLLDRLKQAAPSSVASVTQGGIAWGRYTMNDAIGDGTHDMGLDLRAQYAWLGNASIQLPYTTMGAPMWSAHPSNPIAGDTLGRLAAAAMAGVATAHADASAHAPGTTLPDDPAQPHTMTYLNSDWAEITSLNNHNSASQNEFERGWIERGSSRMLVAPTSADPRSSPTHAYLVRPNGEFHLQDSDPSLNGLAGGWSFMNAYGPYDMAPGQQVRIVLVEGVAGLSDLAAYKIGREYKLNWDFLSADDERLIPFDANGDNQVDPIKERLTKNQWVMTARDSLIQLFQRGISNFRTAYTEVVHPPLPPASFSVRTGANRIVLQWTAPANPLPFDRWEVWRAEKHFAGVITAGQVVKGQALADSTRAYRLVHTAPAGQAEYTWDDTGIQAATDYFYYVQAVSDTPVSDPFTGKKETLRSSRYYTQTYEPVRLKALAGEEGPVLPDVPRLLPVFPNPASGSVRIRFELPAPAQVTLAIYDMLGREVGVATRGPFGAGSNTVDYDVAALPSGTYFCRMQTGSSRAVQVFTVLR